MEIHKPKPAHNVREFLSEILVVVCGILIALALEEGLRALRDRATANEALEAVRGEIRQNLSYMAGRIAVLPCVETRLNEIGDLLEASEEGPLVRRPAWIGQPPVWFLTDQRWQAATSSGRTSLLGPEAQGRIAGIYAFMDRFNDGEKQEQAAWAQLRGLETWRGPLGPAGRIHFLQALQAARYEIWQTRVTVGGAQLGAGRIGLTAPTPRTMIDGRYAIPHAVCLPIDTPREKALSILTRDGSPPWGQPK